MYNELTKKLYEALADVFCNIYVNNGEIEISIDYGDWKHDHLYTDRVLSELGYKKINEQLTDEGDGDCYSSTHYYEKID